MFEAAEHPKWLGASPWSSGEESTGHLLMQPTRVGDSVLNGAAGHPAWLRAALGLALGSARDASAELAVAQNLAFKSARDASAELGLMVGGSEDAKWLMGLGFSAAAGWDPRRPLQVWSDAFDAMTAAWAGQAAAGEVEEAFQGLWNYIEQAAHSVAEEHDRKALFTSPSSGATGNL